MDKKGLSIMQPVLVAKKLSKKYGKVVALDSADLELYPGEVLGVIGDNGAGKSTLIKVLCGAVIPCLLYTSPSPRDRVRSRMPSSA